MQEIYIHKTEIINGVEHTTLEKLSDNAAQASSDIAVWQMPSVRISDGVLTGIVPVVATGGGVKYPFLDASDHQWSCNIPLMGENGAIYDGSDLTIEIEYQLSANADADDDLEIITDYKFMSVSDDIDGAGTTNTDVKVVDSRATGRTYVDSLTDLTGVVAKDYLMVSIKRKATGGVDTYAGDVRVVDIRIKKV